MRPPTAPKAGLSFAPALLVLGTALTASPTSAFADEAPPAQVGFYLQPQLKFRENSPVADDENGFAVRRARVLLSAGRELGCWRIDFRAEVELFPDFTAQDGYLTVSGPLAPELATLAVSVGQFKAPFSRQTLVSDSRLQLVEKAQITSLAPERQIGMAATLGLPLSELSLGIFNGEGKNKTDNADEHFMYVGRATFRPFGHPGRLAESALGLGDEPLVEISGQALYNRTDRGDFDQTQKSYGVDVFAAWQGASVAGEWMQTENSFGAGAPDQPFKANGWYAQGGYLLPLPGWAWRRFEVAARLEEVDRNDQVPIQQAGSLEQSLRYYTLGASYYHAGHDLKLQLQASHIVEVEDETATGADATFANDTLLVQVTYRQ